MFPIWVETVCQTRTTGCQDELHVVVRGIDYNLAADGVYVVCASLPRCGPYKLSWPFALRSMFDLSMGDDERLGA